MIISIGSGKGGVGKTTITANIGAELGSRGKRTIVVDMDLGGANLHVCLGTLSPIYNFSDFFYNNKSLPDIVFDTNINGLKLISSSGNIHRAANLKYSIKKKIISQLKKLDAEYILLDLAPGVSFDTLDFFLIADVPIVITTPEMTSIMNAYTFLMSAILRKLEHIYRKKEYIYNLLTLVEKNGPINSMNEIISRIYGPQDKENFINILHQFKPHLIVNMITDEDVSHIVGILKELTKKYLNISVNYIGHLPMSDEVKESIFKNKPFVIDNLSSASAKFISNIVDNLLNIKL